ncbi:MAG: YcnI family protein, partial [Micromonosporaceae bacterium]|nr:YcnI family protein [Micromonosporaceae bacterium]
MTRAVRLAATALAATAAGVLLLATPASAHVTVNAQDARQGGFTRVAFRVPTESDTLSTTKVEVHLPQDTPIASVSTMPVPGWTVKVSKTKLAQPIKTDDGELTEAVSVITWTAGPGAAIKP